ncbi:MAG: septation protein SpoVG family protein [Patescibacteria group bacterium]|nr:septation protein SpoVG family protein [Patescibacteria group bacterium]
MEITEIQIIPIKANNGLIAFSSIVLNDSLYLSSIGIHKKIDGSGYRLTYPTKKIGDKNLNIYHPINREMGLLIEEAIIRKAKEIFK